MRFPVVLALLFLCAGCASNYSWKDPKTDLLKKRHFYVESELSDGKNLHVTIADELKLMGYNATSGYLTMMPKDADALVSFQSRWTWDFTTYLIELNIQIRDPISGKIIASAGYHRPAIAGTSTEELIRKTLTSILTPKPASTNAEPNSPPKVH
ncbi:MAG: hypothetical protein QM790_20785 [Nibricoccus sp.]